jgi:hypothetical protein
VEEVRSAHEFRPALRYGNSAPSYLHRNQIVGFRRQDWGGGSSSAGCCNFFAFCVINIGCGGGSTASSSGPGQNNGSGTARVSGTISPAQTGSGATLTLSGAASATATADASGNYTFADLGNGTYQITPSKSGFTFSPPVQPVTVQGSNVTGLNFSAAAVISAGSFSNCGTIGPAQN